MRNIDEARSYVNHVTKMCKQRVPAHMYSDEHFIVPTFMMLLTTEANEKYLAKNKYYQQALDEVFDEYMQFYLKTAEKYKAQVPVHANRKYEMLHRALQCFQAIDKDNDLDDISVVNATKLLCNMKMLHERFIDIAIDYSQQAKVTVFKRNFNK